MGLACPGHQRVADPYEDREFAGSLATSSTRDLQTHNSGTLTDTDANQRCQRSIPHGVETVACGHHYEKPGQEYQQMPAYKGDATMQRTGGPAPESRLNNPGRTQPRWSALGHLPYINITTADKNYQRSPTKIYTTTQACHQPTFRTNLHPWHACRALNMTDASY